MKYLYYRLYKIIRGNPDEDISWFGAMSIMSIFHLMNIAVLHMLLNYFSNEKLYFNKKNDVLIFAVILGLIILVLNIFYLFRNRHKILSQYQDESKAKRRCGNAVLLIYFLSSFITLLTIGNIFPLQ